MLEPRRVIQTQLEMRGSENNTHLFLPCLGWVGTRGSSEKQASLHRCQAGARRFLKRSRLDGARTQLRAQVQHAGHPGNSLYVWQMSTPDTRTGNWRRHPQLFSDVQKTGPNGWSAARRAASRAASRESLCPGSSQIIQARGLCGQYKSVSRRGHCSAKGCCPASNAYERGHGDVRHQGKKSKGNTHGRQHRGYPPLTIKEGWGDLQKSDLKCINLG